MKILATGIDTLEVGYEIDGFKNPSEIEDLETFKQMANEDKIELPFTIADHEMSLSWKTPTRYNYLLTDGKIWLTINKNIKQPKDSPEIHVKFSSAYLWTTGLKQACQEVDLLINSIATIICQKISRADYAVDLESPLPETKFEQFVTRLRSKNDFILTVDQLKLFEGKDLNHLTNQELISMILKIKNKRELSVMNHAKGTFNTGFVLGKSSIQLRQYDKDFEIEHSGKQYFTDIWAAAGRQSDSKVTRTEFQCQRDFLKSYDVNTIDDLINTQNSMWKNLSDNKIRICTPGDPEHRERWENTPFWDCLTKADFKSTKGLGQGPEKQYNRKALLTFIRGCSLNLAAHGEPINLTIPNLFKQDEFLEELKLRSVKTGIRPHATLFPTEKGAGIP